MGITVDNANQIIAEVASGMSPTDFKSRIDVTRDGVTLSDDEMEKAISEQENYKPVSEEDIEAIRGEILRARITEVPKGTKIFSDDEKNDEWIRKQNEWNEKVRNEVEAMTDEEVVAWAKSLNEQFRSVVEIQKKDFEKYKSAPETVEDANHDKDPACKYKTPDQWRRHFLRITNPDRKRGDPISKEPESAHRFLKQCKFVREWMDFDHMSKLELKTRLIQTIAAQCIQLTDLQESHRQKSKAIGRFLEKHPEHQEEFDLICSEVDSGGVESNAVNE